MTAFHEAPKGITPNNILAQCTLIAPTDKAYIEHEIIQRFGRPKRHVNCHKEHAENYLKEWERTYGGEA